MADLSATFGVTLDGWQELILRAAMGERSDRTWAAKRVGVTVPRQNGKSQLLVARALAGALLFGEKKIVISAHQQDTAREAFAKLMEIVEADQNGALRARVKSVMNALNREAIRFTNGAQIQFKARSGPGGKGFSADCLMLDEAQILGQRAWTSINSTMSAMKNPQAWLLGTAPQAEDDSEVFEAVRSAAISGKSTAAAWAEWGAEPGADPALEYTRWSANPAWNTRINHEVVQGEYETYPADKFAQDRLGIWPSDTGVDRAISADSWDPLKVASAPDGVRSYGVKFSVDGMSVALSVAVKSVDGGPVHVETVKYLPARQSGELVPWLVERWRDTAAIVIDGKAGAGALEAALRAEKVPAKVIVRPTADQYTAAHKTMLDAITDERLSWFEGDEHLSATVQHAVKRDIGTQGGWGWGSSSELVDITPLDSATLAHYGAVTSKRVPGRKQVLL